MPTLSSGALRNGNPERFDGLPGERTAAQVNDGDGSQQRQAFSRVLEILLSGKERGLAVQRVEDGLHQQQVNAAVHEAANLFVVGVAQLIEGHGARRGARDFLRCRCRAAGGSERARHPARARGILDRKTVGGAARHLGPGAVEVVDETFQLVIRHGDGGGVEGVGLNDVRAGVEVLPMDILNDLRAG